VIKFRNLPGGAPQTHERPVRLNGLQLALPKHEVRIGRRRSLRVDPLHMRKDSINSNQMGVSEHSSVGNGKE
jgi:hypothetical protein